MKFPKKNIFIPRYYATSSQTVSFLKPYFYIVDFGVKPSNH